MRKNIGIYPSGKVKLCTDRDKFHYFLCQCRTVFLFEHTIQLLLQHQYGMKAYLVTRWDPSLEQDGE